MILSVYHKFSCLLTFLIAIQIKSLLLPDGRPSIDQRTFTSKIIDDLINTLQPLFKDPNLGILLSNCLPNTLDTTVFYHSTDEATIDSFVITGDIEAMWLRDSANQVLPYVPYAPHDTNLQSLLEGVIARHAKSILINPFANSFNFNASNDGHQSDKCVPPMRPAVYEAKYEIDSPSAFLKLSYWHYYYSGDTALDRFSTDSWLQAVEAVTNTLITMQKDSGQAAVPPYKFQRNTDEAMDTLVEKGRGPPCKPHNGLSRSLFRPSDDATVLPYNIPGNAMACVELNHLQILLKRLQTLKPSLSYRITTDLQSAMELAAGICGTLDTILSNTKESAQQLPYEVDGFGSKYYMDDANIPSLLALPVLGYTSLTNPVYQRTRDYVWSNENPYYFSGSAGAGVGGPHVGPGYIWPLSLMMRAFTSQDDQEIEQLLQLLVNSSAGTGFMHESFSVNDVKVYSRSWFAWANGQFGELLLALISEKPHLVIKNDVNSLQIARSVIKVPVSISAINNPLVL